MKVLSKSRFKVGLECPNKLYFYGDKTYVNQKEENTFLASLAEGGFQVEALARLHYPNGVFIDARAGDYKASFSMTQQALEKEKCCYIRSLSREILNELFPPLKDEDHTLNVFFFYKDKEIKKFFNYAVKKYANAFEYDINNSALSTQSRVGLIKKPRSGYR